MNKDWNDFLKSNSINPTNNSKQQCQNSPKNPTNSISALTNLATVKITGTDATQFLQGQLTCNINELDGSNSFFAAFCNAKGRTISTLVVLKTNDGYLLIMPSELEEKVSSKLRMYILRSDVQLTSTTAELCLIGLTCKETPQIPNLPKTNFAVTCNPEIIIKFPSTLNRYLIISTFIESKSLWSSLKYLPVSHPSTWSFQDISAGLPWLSKDTSEEYIPQMLNIDKLGGISFNKGCYTGQEIIARTHYLGKAKRELFLAECHITAMLENNIPIISKSSGNSVGKILCIQCDDKKTRMLIVITAAEAEQPNLRLGNATQNDIYLIDYQ